MWFMIRCHHGCQLAPRWFLLFGKMVILVLIFHPSWKGVYIWGALKIYTWCMEVGNPYCQKKSQLGGCSTGVGFLAGWLGSARKRAISGYLKKSPPSKQFLKLRFNSNDLDVSLSQDDSASTEGLQLGIPSKWNIILITTASQKKTPKEMIWNDIQKPSLATHMMPIFFWGSKDAFRGPGFWFLGLELTNSFQAFRAPWCGWRSLKICFVEVKHDHLLYKCNVLLA